MRARPVIAAAFCFAFAPPVWAAAAPWIVRSDAIATELLRRDAQLSPEIIASQGVEGLDEQVTVISADFNDRRRKVALGEAAYLQDLLEKETDPHLREDLQILAKNARNQLRSIELDEKYNIPFLNVSDMVFQSLRSLLDEQIAPARRPAALVHLRKYTGQVKGFRPITVACADFTRSEARKPGLLFPVRAEVERALATSRISAEGIEPLFKKAGVKGYERAVALFKRQLADYDAFLRREVLPKARVDFRMPEELYAFALSQVGVEMPPAELAARAHQAFSQTQAELQVLAGKIARDQHLPSADYRDVLRALKQKQLTGDALVATYRQRLKDVEAIIQREQLVTLPERAVRIRVASDAESANSPAPYYNGPRLVGNTGEQGEMVIPLVNPVTLDGHQGPAPMNDFTDNGTTWTLVAHEARPGHELQTSAMLAQGVSIARGLYAFNSANVEGWALYAESLVSPYLPPEGRMMSLWQLLEREARAFLDPELQLGKITPEQALALLKKDLVLSDGMASQEVERYMFRMPGQATAYFYGYEQLRDVRAEAEKAMGARFNQKAFHDFVLGQGMLTLDLIRTAVRDRYIHAPPV